MKLYTRTLFLCLIHKGSKTVTDIINIQSIMISHLSRLGTRHKETLWQYASYIQHGPQFTRPTQLHVILNSLYKQLFEHTTSYIHALACMLAYVSRGSVRSLLFVRTTCLLTQTSLHGSTNTKTQSWNTKSFLTTPNASSQFSV